MALEAYEHALKANPCNLATQCRVAAVHHKLGDMSRALKLYSLGYEGMDNLPGAAMKSWCALGVAELELSLDHLEKAREAATKVLTFPDRSNRHAKAREVLAEIQKRSSP